MPDQSIQDLYALFVKLREDVDQQDKDIDRLLGIVVQQTELLRQFQINVELITAKLP